MKPDLTVRWSKREGALVYDGHKPTGGLLVCFFEHIETPDKKTLAAELEARGYDLTTLRFSIRRRAER